MTSGSMTFAGLVRDVYALLPDALASSELWQGGNGGFTAAMEHVVDGTDLSHRLVFDNGAVQVSEGSGGSGVTFRIHGPEAPWRELLDGHADPMDLLVHGELVVEAATVDLVRQMQPFCLLFMIMGRLRTQPCSP